MKKLLGYWREACSTCLFIYISYALFSWYNDPPKSDHERIFVSLCVSTDFVLLCILLRQLWRKKWRYAFMEAAEGILAKAAKLFAKAFESIAKKWNLGGKQHQNTLAGTTTVTFDFGISEKRIQRRSRSPKWKQLQSDRERLGFLYRYMITEKIKTGTRVYASDTPAEASTRSENSAVEADLFACYAHLRYDERTEPPTRKILQFKDGLER